ncbi:MAG: rhomboid family intramembrane serine protease [Actinobacteria bacterium]|nr:rhomboid family intramembrane serine protease [Actinomycetota bacterium]MBI3686623.1 rhomboid family intramembrane serine protease [Actinomycetota bacterium]
MVIPIHDENPAHRVPLLTWALIIANVAVFLLSPVFRAPVLSSAGSPQQACAEMAYYQRWGAMPAELTENRPQELTAGPPVGQSACRAVPVTYDKIPVLSTLTALFVHAGWLHLLGNMLFLWVFGNNVEDRFGRLRYLVGYLVAGMISAYGYALTVPHSVAPMVGASGAISAVLGAYLMLYPRAKVLTVVVVVPIWLRAWVVLSVWFLIQAVNATGTGLSGPAEVGYLVHLIGFGLGVVAGLVIRHRPALRHRPGGTWG